MFEQTFLSIFCRVLFPGRLDAHVTTQSESPTLDSQKECQRLQSQQEDEGTTSKTDDSLDKDTQDEKTDVSERTPRESREVSEETISKHGSSRDPEDAQAG